MTKRERDRERMREKRRDPAFRAVEAEKFREWFHANPETHRQRVRASQIKRRMTAEGRAKDAANARAEYRRVRLALFAGYGGRCACCGEAETAFLELDHVNGGGRKHYLSYTSPVSVYREVLRAGCPPIYRLLCANCNRGRQRNGGVCPHAAPVEYVG